MEIEEVTANPENTQENDRVKVDSATLTDYTTADATDGADSTKSQDLFGDSSPQYFKERGNACYRENDFKGALEWYSKALTRLEFSENDVLRAQILCNRAACHQALGDWESSIADCSDALCFDESYPKAYVRRSFAFEKTRSFQKSHSDLEKAIQLDPALECVPPNSFRPKYAKRKAQLKQLADQEFEAEKAEMLGKLKDLGNNLLGKIGLSLDNFKVQKNPETGSYNIQFQQ